MPIDTTDTPIYTLIYLHTHANIYIYINPHTYAHIYIYTCVCVCMCHISNHSSHIISYLHYTVSIKQNQYFLFITPLVTDVPAVTFISVSQE